MKRLRTPNGGLSGIGASLLLTGLALAIAGSTAQGATSAPLPTRLSLRPLTQTEIKPPAGYPNYGLASTIQKSAGLPNTGLGQPFYLEVQVPTGTKVTNIDWSVTVPTSSTAALTDSPLGANVPLFEPADKLVYDLGGRKLLVPDKTGAYKVTAVVSTDSTNVPVTLTQSLQAGTYKGAEFCLSCHNGPDNGGASDKTSWTNTLHASMFTRNIDDPASGYKSSCIVCHTVGFDTAPKAVNGGFDDVMTLTGWTFPTVLAPGNWAAVPADLQNVANIQCENCHGPYAAGHMTKPLMAVSYTSGTCAQCHDAMTHHFKQGEWIKSMHAAPVRQTGADCVKCHSGQGFVEMAKGYPDGVTNTTFVAINCTTCHDPHDAANPHQIRKMDDVTLADGTVVTKGGNGKLCMNCHKARVKAEDNVTVPSTRIGPHHGPQADMLAGVNGITYGATIPSSAHLFAVADACVTCHMQATDTDTNLFTYAGGHTFWPSGNGFDAVAACMQCHGPITTFDFARQDYDGDGVVDGVQTEVQHLVDKLAKLLPPLGSTNVTVTTNYTLAQRQAAFNYSFVTEDRSRGVHNAAYAVGLLKVSIADLSVDPKDRDGNGLPDLWEMTYFGHTGVDPKADADGDGLDNLHEYLAGTDPTKKDTDGDGIDDRTELLMGTSPTDPNSVPSNTLTIYHAAEVEFVSKLGKTYQLQQMSAVGAGGWVNVGDPIPGTGAKISVLRPTRYADQEYYRISEQ